MKFNQMSEKLSVEDIANYLNDLENIDSFFILERGDCSYLQCINYKGHILIEERIYSKEGFKHYILGHRTDLESGFEENFKENNGTDNDLEENDLIIDDKFFRRFSNELFSIKEAIDIFTDYYTNIPFENIVKRDISSEFGELEKGFVFVQWLESAVDSFNETLDEFVEMIEPFIVDELKKDCVGHMLAIENVTTKSKDNNDMNNKIINNDDMNIKCSVFQVIDVHWAVESIVEIAEKYEFLDDIILFKKNNIDDIEFFKIDIGDFK